MKTYHLDRIGAAIVLSILFMGVIGLFVLLPVLTIQWAWNFTMSYLAILPDINLWQSSLLYMAGVTLLYLLGFVRVEVRSG